MSVGSEDWVPQSTEAAVGRWAFGMDANLRLTDVRSGM